MGVLKYLGVVSMKAGRTLLYKVKDVATMFNHWKSTIPEFIKEMIRGKVRATCAIHVHGMCVVIDMYMACVGVVTIVLYYMCKVGMVPSPSFDL